MLIFAFFPLLFLLFSFFLFHPDPQKDFREAIIKGSVASSMLLVGITELFSFLNIINFPALCGFWVTATAIAAGYASKNLVKLQIRLPLKSLKNWEIAVLSGMISILFIVGLLAFYCPPNNFDAINYHLSRVEHWVQNHTLAHFPTSDVRQLYSNPLAEMIILQFRILTDSDLFSNSIQFFALIGSLIGAALLAARMGIKRKGQWLTAIFCLTVPMAILQGSSAQNDLVVSFFLLCFSVFLIDWGKSGKLQDCSFMGLSLGLAILTKGTAYMFGLPFFAFIVFWAFKSHRQHFSATMLFIALLICLPITGHYSRNFAFCGAPMGSQAGIRNEANLTNTISNIIKVLATNLSTPSSRLNDNIEEAVALLHDLFDLKPDTRKSHYLNMSFYLLFVPFHEDVAGNPLHILAIMISLLFIFLCNPPINKDSSPADNRFDQLKILKFHGLFLLAGGLIFSSLILWQPWLTRLNLPLLMLSAPLVGFTFSYFHRYVLIAIVAFAFFQALPALFINTRKPILGKEILRAYLPAFVPYSMQFKSILELSRLENFLNRSQLPHCQEIATYLRARGHSQIGLAVNGNWPEYYLWALMREPGTTLRIEHVQLKDPGMPAAFRSGPFNPTCIISSKDQNEIIQLGHHSFIRSRVDFSPVFIYERTLN